MQLASMNSQHLGSQSFVALTLLQHFLDMRPFNGLEAGFREIALGGRGLVRRIHQLRRKIVEGDDVLLGKNRGSLEHVFQRTDISQPVVSD